MFLGVVNVALLRRIYIFIGFLQACIAVLVFNMFYIAIFAQLRILIMKVNLFAVYDTASEVYDGPHPAATDGVALRNFRNVARNPDSTVGKNPEYFSIWRVGEWNDATGEVTSVVKECLGHAIDLLGEND